MHCITYRHYGQAADVLEAVSNYPRAYMDAESDSVLVKVYAASASQHDLKLMEGYFKWPFSRGIGKGGRIPGCSVSGVVTAVGVKVKGLSVGDEVIGMLEKGGALAEFVSAREKCFVLKPKNLTHFFSAALPLAGVAAFHALRNLADIKQNQKVLILNASGGVGTLAVQIAKCIGAHVTGTTSRNMSLVKRRLGADVVFNYKERPWWEAFEGAEFDAIINCGEGGAKCYHHCPLVLKRKTGRYVTLVPDEDEKVSTQRYFSNFCKRNFRSPSSSLPRYRVCKVRVNQKILKTIAHMAQNGRLKPVVDESSFAFSDSGAKLLFGKLAAKSASGKLVMEIDPKLARRMSHEIKPKHCIVGRTDNGAQGFYSSPRSADSFSSHYSPGGALDDKERKRSLNMSKSMKRFSRSIKRGGSSIIGSASLFGRRVSSSGGRIRDKFSRGKNTDIATRQF